MRICKSIPKFHLGLTKYFYLAKTLLNKDTRDTIMPNTHVHPKNLPFYLKSLYQTMRPCVIRFLHLQISSPTTKPLELSVPATLASFLFPGCVNQVPTSGSLHSCVLSLKYSSHHPQCSLFPFLQAHTQRSPCLSMGKLSKLHSAPIALYSSYLFQNEQENMEGDGTWCPEAQRGLDQTISQFNIIIRTVFLC